MKINLPPEWGAEPVPEEKRVMGFIDYFVLWSSLGVGLLVLQAGAILASGMGFLEALTVSLAGSALGSLILALAGLVGSRYGVPTMVSLRPALGRLGSLLPTAMNVLQLVGWTAFEVIVMGEAAAKISGPFLGSVTRIFWMALFTMWCTLLAVGGPLAVVRQWLEKFGIWMVYASTIWVTYQLVVAGVPASPTGQGMPLPLALDLVVAMPVSWMPLVSDYNRFARRPRSGFLGTFAGYTLANTWFYALGAGLALSTVSEDVVTPILTLLYGNLALILILVDETDNAFADIYSAAVSIQNAFKADHWKLAVTVAAISFTVAVLTPITQYENFLLMIGGVFVPLFGVLIADSLSGNYDLEDFYGKAPGLNLRGLVAWLVGASTYFVIVYRYPDLGATIPSLAVSFITHMVLIRRWSGDGLA